jgi:hypothetical protein
VIEIEKLSTDASVTVRIEKKPDRMLSIPLVDFNEIVGMISNIDRSEIKPVDPSRLIHDGEGSRIEYGSRDSFSFYEVNNPSLDPEERGLTKFRNACELIVRKSRTRPVKKYL